MSLLETASLIVTPNAYKEGKLYSVIPSDGSGDFTFTRATTATRVNSDGLVELVPYNLVTYSEQFDNSDWLKAQTTISANATISPDGTQNADKLTINNGLTGGYVYQTKSTSSGTIYTGSFYVKAGGIGYTKFWTNISGIYENAVINLSNGAITNSTFAITPTTQNVGNGWYRVVYTTTSGGGTVVVYVDSGSASNGGNIVGNGTDGIFIWGAQVVQGTNALPYQKTETRLNIPRIDYSNGTCPSLLVEPQRTNLATYSEQFDDASWNKINSSVTANADISPDGYTNADRIYDNATSGQHRVGKNISVVSGTTYTFSVFAKKGSLRYCYLFTVAGGASDRYYFDLQDGVSITAGGKIEDYGSGWYRISAKVTAAATGNELFAFNLTNSPSFPTYSGTGTGYHMIYGYQVEAGNYQTSYIPTTSASVTRNQDLMLLSNIYTNNLLTSSGGTWFVDFRNNVPLTRDSVVRFGLGDTSAISLNSMYFIGGASNGRLIIQKRVAGAVTTLYTTTADTCKIAFKWNGATMDIFENGFKVIADSVFTSTDLNFFNGIAATPYFISSMLLAPTPLTDDECIQLTTI
jgi:hypothetical protein